MTQAQGSTGRLLAGRYRLDAVLGRGGMGTVWRAEDEMLGRIVAVKELRMHGGVDEDEKHRLIVRTLREAKATARIRHTAAVTVFDVVEEDDRPWIVMELVESRSLAEVIKEDGPLDPVRAAGIALDLLGVLGAAHSHGILHRDVKPSNVLIGEDGRVVLTDFGIASVEGDASVTSTGMLVGAPSYISPERARGQKPGPPADLWSLGGTLYAMVEGRPPYDRGSALATLTAVMTEDLATPANAGPLRPVIEGLLEKDPAQRLDASTTRSMLKRIVADATGRAEATTQQAVPVRSVAKAEPGGQEHGKQAAGKQEHGKQEHGKQTPGRQEPGKDADEQSASSARRSVGGMLGTVRVGSRAKDGAAPMAAPDAVPAKPAGGEGGTAARPVPQPRTGEWSPGQTLPLRGRRRKAVLLAATVLVLVLIAGAVALVRAFSGSNTVGSGAGASSSVTAASAAGAATAASTASTASEAPAAPETSSTQPVSQAPAQTPAQGAAPGPAQSSAAAAATPPQTQAAPPSPAVRAGYHEYRDPSGFSIVLPDWLKDAGLSGTRRTFTGNGSTLRVEWTTTPHQSAVADWQSSEPGLIAQVSNYQRIKLEAITYRQWTNAADWEWTNGSPRSHSLNRGFVTGEAKYGYAIYWTVPDSDWNSAPSAEARQTAFDTFQPAP